MAITLVSELIALVANYQLKNNMPVFHVFTPIEFLLVSLYFNYSITYFRRNHIGIIAGITGLILSALNTIYLQPIRTINSYFLMFEGTTIVIYCLLAIHQILLDEVHLPYKFAHFWITICCLVYWSGTFTGWGLYEVLRNDKIVVLFFDKILTVANFVFYIGIGTAFVRYKRLIPTSRA